MRACTLPAAHRSARARSTDRRRFSRAPQPPSSPSSSCARWTGAGTQQGQARRRSAATASAQCSTSGRRASGGATRAHRRRGLSLESTHGTHRLGRHVGTGVGHVGQRAGTCEHCLALPDLRSKAQDEVTGKRGSRGGRNEHGGELWHMLGYGMRLSAARKRPYPARASPGQRWSKRGAHRTSARWVVLSCAVADRGGMKVVSTSAQLQVVDLAPPLARHEVARDLPPRRAGGPLALPAQEEATSLFPQSGPNADPVDSCAGSSLFTVV